MTVKALDTTRISQARSEIQRKFFRADEVVDRLEMFVAMNMIEPRSGNAIFYGKGGYGKTEMTAEFLRIATGEEPFVVNMNQATTPFDMFGGIDLPQLTNQGKLEYQFDRSFMAHKWVIFEEGLEPRPKVLSALKYIITSGIFSGAGTSSTPIKTQGIVIATNIDTATFMDSDDTRAFLERFPIQYKVGWEKLTQYERYDASYKVVGKFDPDDNIGYEYRKLIAENTSVRQQSPREISRIVQAMLAKQAIRGGGMVSEETFTDVMAMFGLMDKNLSEQIEEQRIEQEIRDAKAGYEQLFDTLTKNLSHYKNLEQHLDNPKYIVNMATQIKSTMKLISDIENSVIAVRTNPDLGTRGSELASWINTRVGEFTDDIDAIKMASWDGILGSVTMLIEKLEKAGIQL